jgi:hypothetical protein
MGGKWQISYNGAAAPRWSRTGRELVYRSYDQVMSVSYSANGDTFIAEKPRVWIPALGSTAWDLVPDGKRGRADPRSCCTGPPQQEHLLVMLQNFADELRRRVPLGR